MNVVIEVDISMLKILEDLSNWKRTIPVLCIGHFEKFRIHITNIE